MDLGDFDCTTNNNQVVKAFFYLSVPFIHFFFNILVLADGAFQNHSRLRTPPLPLSHSHSPSHQHHAASINSLNRGNYTPRSNPSPAPTDSSVPPEGPASGQDSGSAQDNWLLNSNIPLETRYSLNSLTLCMLAAVGWAWADGIRHRWSWYTALNCHSASKEQIDKRATGLGAMAYICDEHNFVTSKRKALFLACILCSES